MCAPEFSDIETAIWQKYKDRGVVVLGASDEAIETIQKFVKEQGVTFPVMQDRARQLYYSYFLSGAISPYPRDYIIDQDGVFRYTNVEYDINDMTLVIESLLENPTRVNQENGLNKTPTIFKIQQNYPNPFNPQTTIEYELDTGSFIEISVYNIKGEKMRTLVKRNHEAGAYSVEWSGMDGRNQAVPSGVYLYKFISDGSTETRKMTVLR